MNDNARKLKEALDRAPARPWTFRTKHDELHSVEHPIGRLFGPRFADDGGFEDMPDEVVEAILLAVNCADALIAERQAFRNAMIRLLAWEDEAVVKGKALDTPMPELLDAQQQWRDARDHALGLLGFSVRKPTGGGKRLLDLMDDDPDNPLHKRIEELDRERYDLRNALLQIWRRERSHDHTRHPELSKGAWEHVEAVLHSTRRSNERE